MCCCNHCQKCPLKLAYNKHAFKIPEKNYELQEGDLILHNGRYQVIAGNDPDGDRYYMIGTGYEFPWNFFDFICRPHVWHTPDTSRPYPCPALCGVCPACVAAAKHVAAIRRGKPFSPG